MKIPIKKYVMDESLSWEERYKQLEAHHKEETEWLIARVKELEKPRTWEEYHDDDKPYILGGD